MENAIRNFSNFATNTRRKYQCKEIINLNYTLNDTDARSHSNFLVLCTNIHRRGQVQENKVKKKRGLQD